MPRGEEQIEARGGAGRPGVAAVRRWLCTLAFLAGAATLSAESLRYKIIWPTGVSLGTARLESTGEPSDKPAATHQHTFD